MTITATLIENDGRNWYEINGTNEGAGLEFEGEVIGVDTDGELLDADGMPMLDDDDRTATYWINEAIKKASA